MSDQKLYFYPQLPSIEREVPVPVATGDQVRLEPATCTEAEPFALRVLDDSMLPEFRNGCIILIDPTGRATDGSYVLAHSGTNRTDKPVDDDTPEELDGLLFRQLRQKTAGRWSLCALNEQYPEVQTADDLSRVIGVIVQRAGVRRSYHKNYY